MDSVYLSTVLTSHISSRVSVSMDTYGFVGWNRVEERGGYVTILRYESQLFCTNVRMCATDKMACRIIASPCDALPSSAGACCPRRPEHHEDRKYSNHNVELTF